MGSLSFQGCISMDGFQVICTIFVTVVAYADSSVAGECLVHFYGKISTVFLRS
jgi:hypothetical protein